MKEPLAKGVVWLAGGKAMSERRDDDAEDGADEHSYTAEGVRQGTIVLRSRERRAIFIGGLVAIVVVIVILGLAL